MVRKSKRKKVAIKTDETTTDDPVEVTILPSPANDPKNKSTKKKKSSVSKNAALDNSTSSSSLPAQEIPPTEENSSLDQTALTILPKEEIDTVLIKPADSVKSKPKNTGKKKKTVVQVDPSEEEEKPSEETGNVPILPKEEPEVDGGNAVSAPDSDIVESIVVESTDAESTGVFIPDEDAESLQPTTFVPSEETEPVLPDNHVTAPSEAPDSSHKHVSDNQGIAVKTPETYSKIVPRKRPTAADLIDDAPIEEKEDAVTEKPNKRAKVVVNSNSSTSDVSQDPEVGSIAKGSNAIGEEIPEEEKPEEEEEPAEVEESQFLGYPSFDAYANSLLPSVVNFLKVTKQLPSNKDEFDFYQSYPSFMAFSKNQGQRVLQLIGKIFKHHHVYQRWNTLPTHTVTGIDEQTEAVVEANDTLLERVDKILDMLRQNMNKDSNARLDVQQKNPKNALVAAWNTNNSSTQNKPIRLLHSKNILRPQLRWKVKPDNSSAPFVPLIREKLNAKVPLQPQYSDIVSEGTDTCGISSYIRNIRGDDIVQYPHPYETELDELEQDKWQFDLGLKQEPKELKDTPLTVIDQVEQIPGLVETLAECREIAVDLEAHSYRSFLGFTCLMQLSTRTADFIVDTLALRTDLQPLNRVFTDPKILKVFHGANNDIKWLQRDLGLYIVNMFDTFHAAKQLGLPRCSLSYLLHKYCDVTADKQYQLADWRIRPLPDVMMKYAREDTHFLLYVYDCMRYELLNKGIHALESVYRNSTTECRELFAKPVFKEDSYLEVYHKVRIALKPQQKECLRAIFAWRDQTARSEDESTAFVLPNHMMFKIAELLPPDQEGILACCNPPPPLVRLHVQELHLIVEKARHYNPLLDPANIAKNQEEEYTPGFLDTTHQSLTEELLTPKATPARRIKERKEIFYVPRTGPDVVLKKSCEDEDSVSLASESGTISGSVSSLQFFDTSTIREDLTEAVRSVKESMTAPFKLFMSKIAQLHEEEEEKLHSSHGVVYPITEVIPKEEEEEVDTSVIEFKTKNKRPAPANNELHATSKKTKRTVGHIEPFNYQEVTMSSMGATEDVKPRIQGDMLNKGEDAKSTQVRARTNMKSGNRSGFQNFLKKKFKR